MHFGVSNVAKGFITWRIPRRKFKKYCRDNWSRARNAGHYLSSFYLQWLSAEVLQRVQTDQSLQLLSEVL